MIESQEVSGRKRRSREEIQRLMMEFESSGLGQNEFCRRHGLALSTLQRQLKKRRLDQGEAKSSRLVAVELASKGRAPIFATSRISNGGILKAAFWRTTRVKGLLLAESFREETHVVGVFLQKFFFLEAQFREFNRHRHVIVGPFVPQRVLAYI